MQEPLMVRSFPTLLYYGQFVLAAFLGTLYAQILLPDWLDSPRLEHWLLGLVFMWPFKPLIDPFVKFLGLDKLPPSCPVCEKIGGWWPPQDCMLAFGEGDDPNSWRFLHVCPVCRECGWVKSGESRICYVHPPEFCDTTKVYRKNFISGSWCWESSEDLSSATSSDWKLYNSAKDG